MVDVVFFKVLSQQSHHETEEKYHKASVGIAGLWVEDGTQIS
jgi:hypothetical protein